MPDAWFPAIDLLFLLYNLRVSKEALNQEIYNRFPQFPAPAFTDPPRRSADKPRAALHPCPLPAIHADYRITFPADVDHHVVRVFAHPQAVEFAAVSAAIAGGHRIISIHIH